MINFSDKCCFICGGINRVEVHHIFGASNRSKSDKDGLTVYLCANCHREAADAVHKSGKTAKLLHAMGELMWLAEHPDKDIWQFVRRYGRNYLEDWKPRR